MSCEARLCCCEHHYETQRGAPGSFEIRLGKPVRRAELKEKRYGAAPSPFDPTRSRPASAPHDGRHSSRKPPARADRLFSVGFSRVEEGDSPPPKRPRRDLCPAPRPSRAAVRRHRAASPAGAWPREGGHLTEPTPPRPAPASAPPPERVRAANKRQERPLPSRLLPAINRSRRACVTFPLRTPYADARGRCAP